MRQAQSTWYPAQTPPVSGHPVEVAWNGRQSVVTPGWYEDPSGHTVRRWMVVPGADRRPRPLQPSRGEIATHWRPLPGDSYPALLPEPERFQPRQAMPEGAPARVAAAPEITSEIDRGDDLAAFAERINRALKTMLALPDREAAWLRRQTAWPFDIVATQADLNDRHGNAIYLADLELRRLTRFRPTPADIADMDAALQYFNALSLPLEHRRRLMRARKWPFSHEQRLIWWRMRGMTFTELATKLGVNDDTARRRYWRAIDECRQAGERLRRRSGGRRQVLRNPAGAD